MNDGRGDPAPEAGQATAPKRPSPTDSADPSRGAGAFGVARETEAPQRAGDRILAILETVRDGFLVLDRRWRFAYINRHAAALVGREPGELIGRNIWDELPQLRGTPAEAHYRKAMAEQVATGFEMRGPLSGRWFRIDAYPSPEGLSIYGRDITAQRRAEADVRDGEQRYRALCAATSDVVIMHELGIVLDVNDNFARMFGYEAAEAIGRDVVALLAAPESREVIWCRILAGSSEPYEAVLRRKDGSTLVTEIRGKTIPYLGRAVRVATVRDITDWRRAAGELERSEERYRSFLQQSSEGIWRFETGAPIPVDRPEDELIEDFYRHTTLAECNDACARMYGYASAEDIIGAPLEDFLPRSDPHNVAYLRAFIRSGFRLHEAESHEVDRDGNAKYFLNNLVGVVRDGCLVRAWGTQRDITEQRRAEAQQRLLAEASRILGSSLDYEATLASVCRLVVPVLADWCTLDLATDAGGLERLVVAHRDPAKVRLAEEARRRYPPDPADRGGLMAVLRTGEPELYPEITEEMLAGGARDAEHLALLRSLGPRSAVIVPLRARGRTLGVLSLVAAESGRRFTDAELQLANELATRASIAVDNARLFREAERAVRVRDEALQLHRGMDEKLTLLVEASEGLSASLDPESVLQAILALSRRLISADAYAVWRHRPTAGRWGIELASGLSEAYQRSSIEVVDTTPTMPDSPVIAEDVHQIPMLGPRAEAYRREGVRSLMSVPLRVHGSITGTLVFYYRDPHRFSEIEVRVGTALANLAGAAIGTAQLYQELRDNDRRKDEFLAMLAHELRNPLSAVTNAVHVSRRATSGEHLEWSRAVIERQAARLTRLIDDLLDVSRITRGKIRLDMEILDAGAVVRSAVESVRPLVEERRHELVVSRGAGDLRVQADPTRLEQVLINLLTNAAKYTEPGGHIWVTVERADREVAVQVRDDGIGIPPESLPTMFELFAQGERSFARSEGGLGIGLTLVRSLTEMHGGSVAAHSEGHGTGSVFTVRLPAAAGPLDAEARPEPLPERATRGEPGHPRILIIDDNADATDSLAMLLTLYGHDVAAARDGPSGLEAARRYRPEIILLDIGLPGMSGYEVAASLREEDAFKDALIIAVSGYGQEEDRRRSRAAGFDHHLVKPVDFDSLLSLIGRTV